MTDLIINGMSSQGFMPHGHCFLWTPPLLTAFVVADALIGLSYYTIPLGLLYFVVKRKDLRFNWMFRLFSIFIFSCGTSHFLAIWTIWHPDYWLEAGVKAVTALASVITGFLLWPLIPRAIKLPSTRQLEYAVAQLDQEIVQRKASEAELSRLKNASEARFHHLFGQFAVGIVEFDLPSRRVLRVNRKYCEIMGYDQAEMARPDSAGSTLLEDIRTGLSNAARGNGQPHELVMEKRYARKDGCAVWLNVNVSPLLETGEPAGTYIAIVKDVSKRVLTEQTLRRQFDELKRWQEITLGRETRVLELKREVNQLLAQVGQPLRYAGLAPGNDLDAPAQT